MYRALSEQPSSRLPYYSADDFDRAGVAIGANDIGQIARTAWADITARKHYGIKSVLSLSATDLAAYPDVRETVNDGERLGWKLSCLTSVNDRYGAVKIVGANALNRRSGLPRSHSTILLLDKLTMVPLCIFDGTEVSAARTATYPLIVLDKFFAGERGLSVFLFGAGPVGAKIVAALGSVEPGRIDRVLIRSRTGESARALAERTDPEFSFRVQAVDDNRKLRDCQLVITASNASGPVFDADEVAPFATVLHLAGDETPAPHIARTIRQGLVFCDSIELVSRRNSQSLALYFTRKGATLEHVGPLLGIRELADVEIASFGETRLPVHVTCVGLPILDLHAAVYLYERFIKAPARKTSERRADALAVGM